MAETPSMLELVGYIARSLVEEPAAVTLAEEAGPHGSALLRLGVARQDLGRVIGRQGRTARAIRTVLSAASTKQRQRYVLEIQD